MQEKLLIVDDETDILNMLEDYFTRNGYQVMTAASGTDAIGKVCGNPDMILLDINLPDMDGLTVCRKIRDTVSCPILFLTARDTDADKVIGLKTGGDDYMVKPFSMAELGARVEAHLRRENRPGKRPVVVRADGEFVIDCTRQEVLFKGKPLPLQKREYEIVEFLALHPGQLMSREQIFQNVWSYDSESDPSVVMAHVSSIRAKFAKAGCKPYIQTVWGSGYRWEN